jgi:uncharacterized protein
MGNDLLAAHTPDPIKPHTIGQSFFYHLLPGILGGILYYAIAQPVRHAGYPSFFALVLAGIFVLIPLELGILLYQGYKKNGKISLDGIVMYRQRIKIWEYFLWVPIIFVTCALVMTLFNPVSNSLVGLFNWVPKELRLDMGLSGEYSKGALIATYLLSFIFLVIVLPSVEELYFRGFLLPRMSPALKGWAPIFHSFLFALYHTWTPWLVIARTAGVLPLIYVVRWKKNVYLGVIAHCLLNVMDVVAGVIFILSL